MKYGMSHDPKGRMVYNIPNSATATDEGSRSRKMTGKGYMEYAEPMKTAGSSHKSKGMKY